jgi:2-amino-4-hydroxy-6-hydroxymethyldihydropteridine diphosphokinase
VATAFISLGSNMGDRIAYLQRALQALEEEPVSLGAVSPLYETAPVGGPPQARFFNACASFDTLLPPAALLPLKPAWGEGGWSAGDPGRLTWIFFSTKM